MSYACHDVTQFDGRETSIFIVISFVGISLSNNHVVKTRQCSFIIHASVWPMLSLWSSDKCFSIYGAVILSCCSTLKCASLNYNLYRQNFSDSFFLFLLVYPRVVVSTSLSFFHLLCNLRNTRPPLLLCNLP
jgi:hypothetical protein